MKHAESRQETLFLAACLLAGAPVIAATFQPMTILPQRAAQVAVPSIESGDFPFPDLFAIR